VLVFADSVTFDIKAVDDEVHRALTGAAVSPVLRNAERIGKDHPEKLWEFRVLVIPDVTDQEVPGVCELIASIDPELPVCFLAFRPNHVLDHHPGASEQLMKHCLEVARQKGLRNAHRAGFPGIDGRGSLPDPAIVEFYDSPAAHLAASYARSAGCTTNPRSCVDCELQCSMRSYLPTRVS
jgi:pyruvate formate lyase activating enzyme